jgi:alkaline phosphatase D
MVSRRHFLLGSATATLHGCAGLAVPEGKADTPFNLGIASGDPTAHGIVLWTRICPGGNPFEFPEQTVKVSWLLAEDPHLTRNVRSGSLLASADSSHCVHVELEGLEPGKDYYYQFEALGQRSRLGRTRTLPPAGMPIESLKIALTSCQEYSTGYFNAYADVVAKSPDFILHSGDYIYESGAGDFRNYPFEEAFSLTDYRVLYALYRQDPYLRQAHEKLPWIILWDDHEVVNDWGQDHFVPSPYNLVPAPIDFHTRKAAAIKAFFEHMPIRQSRRQATNAPNLYQRLTIGDLVELNVLDVRSYRDGPVCDTAGSGRFSPCDMVNDTDRQYLGNAQEAWLLSGFGSSHCRWNVLAQTTVMTPFDLSPGSEIAYETDGWDNYPQARNRLLQAWRQKRITNVVSLGGNIHAFYAGVLAAEHGQCSIPIGTEIVTTSISASGGGQARYRSINDTRQENPCMEFFDNRQRGYALVEFDQRQVRTQFRVANSIQTEEAMFSTLFEFLIESGNAGARR